MKRIVTGLFLVLAVTSFAFASGKQETSSQVVVFAAASTTDVMQTLADYYTEETGIPVVLNPASSGTLAKQLSQGAEADIFISASKKWMTYAVDEGLVESSGPFAANRIVLIAPSDSDASAAEIGPDYDFLSSFEGRLSMGDPAHVPAGAYAKEALDYYGWYEGLEERILPAANVRAALSVVELDETERGIVYRTDALKTDKVKILGTFPMESHTPVSYFSALLKGASEEGAGFYDFIVNGDRTEEALKSFGFDMKS